RTELNAFVYDFHLYTIILYQINTNKKQIFSREFLLITFLQDFIEFYPNIPFGLKRALLKTVIYYPIDMEIIKYVKKNTTSILL
ncbi:unnamed protein product, partial [Rotaria sordida]